MFQITNRLIEGLVFANTPSYLYQRLVEFVASNNFSVLHNQALQAALRPAEESVEAIAGGYVAFLVLLRRGKKFEELEKTVGLKALPWAAEIAKLDHQLGATSYYPAATAQLSNISHHAKATTEVQTFSLGNANREFRLVGARK